MLTGFLLLLGVGGRQAKKQPASKQKNNQGSKNPNQRNSPSQRESFCTHKYKFRSVAEP
jgi:hypothetical protein